MRPSLGIIWKVKPSWLQKSLGCLIKPKSTLHRSIDFCFTKHRFVLIWSTAPTYGLVHPNINFFHLIPSNAGLFVLSTIPLSQMVWIP